MGSLQWLFYKVACKDTQATLTFFRHHDDGAAQKEYNNAITSMTDSTEAGVVQQQGVTLRLASGRTEEERAAAQVLAVCRRSHAS
jgi:hypothetical protein